MSAIALASVDDYLASKPHHVQPILEAVRQAIRLGLPQSEEGVSYGIPVYKIDGKAVIYFAGWKKHYAIYPASDAILSAFAEELEPCKVVKSTLQFDYSKPVPGDLIQRIADFRAIEVSGKVS